MNQNSPILFSCINGTMWIRIEGRGSFEISPHLRQFAIFQIGKGFRRFVLDLELCPSMDSTFMGTLLSTSKEVERLEGGQFEVVNANPHNSALLNDLGLDMLISIDHSGTRWTHERQQVTKNLRVAPVVGPSDRQTTTAVMLEAHEALADVAPENEDRFRDVIYYLKNDSHPKR